MAGIKATNTKPELRVRQILHRLGFRFRLHRKDLPGRPDIVLPKYRVALFVHGCFWHGHDHCPLFRLPRSREEFWARKITANRTRDRYSENALRSLGWKTVVVWECALKGRTALEADRLPDMLRTAIVSPRQDEEIRGEMDSQDKENES